MMAKPCRKDLLQWINVVSFAVDDVKLFLDTHPCDQNALAYFQEYSGGILRRQMELDQRAMAMAGRGMLIDVEL